MPRCLWQKKALRSSFQGQASALWLFGKAHLINGLTLAGAHLTQAALGPDLLWLANLCRRGNDDLPWQYYFVSHQKQQTKSPARTRQDINFNNGQMSLAKSSSSELFFEWRANVLWLFGQALSEQGCSPLLERMKPRAPTQGEKPHFLTFCQKNLYSYSKSKNLAFVVLPTSLASELGGQHMTEGKSTVQSPEL